MFYKWEKGYVRPLSLKESFKCRKMRLQNEKCLEVVFAGSGKGVTDRISTRFQNSLSDLPPLYRRYLKLVRVIHLQRNRRNTIVYDESEDKQCTDNFASV